MKKLPGWLVTGLACGAMVGLALAAPPAKRALFNSTGFRPQVTLHDVAVTTDKPFVSITGVVFSRSAIDRVTIGDRTAATRQAEPKDLMNLQRVPDGATEAPYRTYFEVRDYNLPKFGANDIEIRGMDGEGRGSDVHRLTVVRLTSAPAAAS